jgi:hypothetical protein
MSNIHSAIFISPLSAVPAEDGVCLVSVVHMADDLFDLAGFVHHDADIDVAIVTSPAPALHAQRACPRLKASSSR